ncbi:MAG: Uma2 family endonuclease [Archangium sp.]
MSTAPKSNSELLLALAEVPDEQTGEVINGSLYVTGRPSLRHQHVELEVTSTLKRDRLCGWRFFHEVAVRFPTDEEVVPDVSGWREVRFEGQIDENPIRVRPDWVCEILSDSTRVKDLGAKRRLYAQQGVPYLWLIDPVAKVLEAFELVGNNWQLQGTWAGEDVVRGIAPWPDLTLKLSDWWLP